MFATSSVSLINVNDGINGTNGINGQDGAQGPQGIGIVGSSEQWYLSNRSDQLVGGEWSYSEPSSIPNGKYLWGRIEFTMSDGSTQHSDAVYRATMNGIISTVDSDHSVITNKVWESYTQQSINDYDNVTGSAIRDRVTLNETDIDHMWTAITDNSTTTTTKSDGTVVTTLSSRVHNVEDTAEQHTREISAVSSQVENLAIGTKNYIRNSEIFDITRSPYISSTATSAGSQNIKDGVHQGYSTNSAARIIVTFPQLLVGEEYIFSYDWCSTWNINQKIHTVIGGTDTEVGEQTQVDSTLWRRNSVKFVASASTTQADIYLGGVSGSVLYVRHFQLEMGNLESDWHISDEETAEILSDVKTTASQTAEKFLWIVQDGSTASQVTYTSNALTAMANQIDLTGKVTFRSFDSATQNAIASGAELIVGTQAGSTSAWTGTSAKLSAINSGARISYKLPYASTSTAVTLNLTLNNNTTTGAKNVYYINDTRLTTQYGVNSIIELIYDGTAWRVINPYSDSYDRTRYQQPIKAGSTAIVGGNIIVAGANNVGTYTHLKLGNPFDTTYPILYAVSSIAANSTGTDNYLIVPMSLATTQSGTYTAYKSVYIKGTLSGTTFIPVSTTPLTQTIPSSADGYHYMLLGTMYSTTHMYLLGEHPIFQYYKDGFKTVSQIASEAADYASQANANASSAASTASAASTTASQAVGTANAASTNATNALNGIKAFTGTSSADADTATKGVSCTDTTFAMTNGVTITVTFSNASTADAPKLNVNSLGEKAIYFDNAVTSSNNRFRWQAGSVITFQYNGTYWVVLNYENLEYFTSSTAAGTATKTNATATGTFVLCKGTTINVYFSTANSANAPSLNIGATGVYAIYYKNQVTSSSNQYFWSAGTTLTFTYNGSYWYVNDGGAQLVKDYAKTAVDWIGTNGQTTINATDIMKAWVDDATLTELTIDGGYLKAHTIESNHLKAEAIMSSNYEAINGSHFSSQGSFLDLDTGNFYTPNFGVCAEDGAYGAYINGDVVATSGKIGSNTTNYWEIGNKYDYNAVERGAIIGHGSSYIQAGNWQLSNDKLNTQSYVTTQESSGRLQYYKDTNTNTFYDVGVQIPNDFTSVAPSTSGDRYAKSFFYGRKFTGNSAPQTDDSWTYFYLVDISGNVYASGNIYEGGVKLSDKYAAKSGVESVYLPLTGGVLTGPGDLTVNGTLISSGALQTTLRIQTNLSSASAATFTGSANATVSPGITGTLGVGNGGTGKSSWTQWGVVYASATNALAQASTNASGQILQSNVSAAPSWVSPSTITVGRATGDADGNPIKTTYRKLNNNSFDSATITSLNAGDLVVTGSASFTNGIIGTLSGTATSVSNNLKIQLNGGTTEGTNQFTYNGSAAKTVNVTKSSIGLGNVENTAISTWAGSSNLTTTKVGTLAAAATKAVDSSISAQSTSTNLPTSAAVASFVEGKGYVTSSGVTSITLTAGAGISLNASTAITSTGTRTITNSGVRSISESTSNGKISVNTNGTSADVAVHGLGSWAYKSSGSASDVGLDPSNLVKSIASNNQGKLVLTYFDNSTSDPIEVMIVGSTGSSVSFSDALNVNGTAVGSAEQPVYFNNQGKPVAGNKIPKLNNGTTGGTFYAPTGYGTSGQYLQSNGNAAPTWATFSKSTVGLGNVDNTADVNKRVKGANITTTANAVAYYTDTTGTFGSKASANGALYATSANGALNWGTLPIAQGGTGMTSATSKGIVYATSTTALATTAAGSSGQVLTSGGTGNPSWTTATNANTASAIVKRDASGNFSAGTITASLSGNATTATTASNVSGAAGTVNSARHVWFSDSTTETVRNYDDDFKYNPNTNTLTVANVSGNATSATKATQDGDGATISSTYAKLSGATFTGAVSGTSFSASGYLAANSSNSGTAGGIALYGSNPVSYGIAMRNTTNGGKHGYVQGDWAIYSYMSGGSGSDITGSNNRGWILKNTTRDITVASVNGEGHAVFNGSVTIGGNTTNTSGMRMEYDSTLKCTNFVFY